MLEQFSPGSAAIGLIVGLVLGVLGVAFPGLAMAHVQQGPHGTQEPTPEPANAAESEWLHECQVFGVRAAWGAVARYAGAPRVILNHPKDEIEPIFMGKQDVPTDGIWIDIDELTRLGELDAYIEAVHHGWDSMDATLEAASDLPLPEFELLIAQFTETCKRSTLPKSQRP